MKTTTDRIVTATFCDDIRHEIGNKMSLMGCYQSELFVASTPTILPKFCIFATAHTPKNRSFKSLVFKVMLDNTIELAKFEVPGEGLTGSDQTSDSNSTRMAVSAAIMFSPFNVEKPTILRVNAITEEGEIVGPRIQIKVNADSTVMLEGKTKLPQKAAIKKPPAKLKKNTSKMLAARTN